MIIYLLYHVACQVASKHYLQVTDEDFEQALGASNRGQQSVRQSVQYRTERSRTGSLEDFTDSQCTTIPDHAGGCVDPTTIKYPLKDSRMHRIAREMKSSRPALTQM